MFGATRFLQQLQAYCHAVSEYEDPQWQREALQRIPTQTLQERANQAMAESAASGSGAVQLSYRDELLKALLHWFKFDFFRWTNTPSCAQCQSATTAIGGTAPNAEEQRWRAGVVELYRCNTCGSVTRFPRYNHPLKLLDSRAGRCGEWANCFSLCCRALQFEVRAVHDWTDHVWTEVWSESQRRWIHLDPCEDVMDRPLLYEEGWGKALNYVIATSVDEVVDVTRRYTRKYPEVKSRRTVLVSMLSLERWRRQSPARQRLLLERGRAEQRELQGAEVIDHRLGVGDIAGRTTGSAEWRRARGEMGDEVATQRAIQQQQRTHDRIISANTRTSQPHHSTDGPEKGKATGTSTAQPTPSTPAPHPSTTAAPAASSESSSSSMPSTAPPPPSVLGAPGAIDAGRAMVKLLFSRYHAQLTQGCGRPGCTNELCRSSSAFVPPPKGEDGAMAIATRCLQLTRQYRDRGLCEHVNKDSEERKTASAADATER